MPSMEPAGARAGGGEPRLRVRVVGRRRRPPTCMGSFTCARD